MRIGICDNNGDTTRFIGNQLKQVRAIMPSVLVSYGDEEVLLGELERRDEAFDILILNTRLGKADAMAIAKLSLERNANCQIIFITDDRLQRPACYEIRHVYMLPKAELSAWLMPAVLAAAERLKAAHAQWITVTVNAETHIIDAATVVYMERMDRQTLLVMENGRLTTYQTPQKLISQLSTPIILRCHRSIYVNLYAVAGYRTGALLLRNGETLPVGRKHQQTVREEMDRFVHGVLSPYDAGGQV